MSKELNDSYWNDRYLEQNTGWDLGEITPPLKAYIDQLKQKNTRVLIPGCGKGHEGTYLFEQGFTEVHMLDFAQEPISFFQSRNPNFPVDHLHVENFFTHQGSYDLMLEQTLFCALDPSLRSKYAEKAASLLKPGGSLVGLLFNRDFEGGPPFGGAEQEYRGYFEPYFKQIRMEVCYNSIKPREGSELFIHLIK
jgi:SAM-dependent methyltransferase